MSKKQRLLENIEELELDLDNSWGDRWEEIKYELDELKFELEELEEKEKIMKTIKLEIRDKRNDMVLLQETFTAKELFEDLSLEEQQAKTIQELKDAVKSRKDELFYWDNYKKDYFKKIRNYSHFLIKSDDFTRFVKFRNIDLKVSIKQVKGGK